MNLIKVTIDFEKGICRKEGISLITGDYNSTKIVFEFNKSAENGTKIFKLKNPKDEIVYADEIVDNEVVLVGKKEENGEEEIYSLFTEEGDYTFEVALYVGDSRITSVYDYITAAKEQIVLDGEVVESKITLFDNLMQELEENIGYVENIDVEAEKVDTTTTITITRKDGTTKEVQVLDGEKGEQGPKGDAGSIKFEVVQELPTEDIDPNAIYLVPIEPDIRGNNYAEYIYVNNEWELLGKIGVQVDLTDYATIEYVDNLVGDIESILTTLDVGSGV